MAENLSLKINIDGQEKVINNVRELKKAIRDAEFQALALTEQYGESDARVIAIRESVGRLKNAMQDATDQSKAFSEDSKFPAVAKSIQGLASGFTAVQGAMALMGVESEAVEKTLLKVNAAMAFSQGLGGLIESIDSFKILNSMIQGSTILKKADNAVTAVATSLQMGFTGAVNTTSTAFKGLKAAIASTGIGLLVIGITMLVTKLIEWANSTEDVEKQTKALNKELENQKRLTDDNVKSIDTATKIQIANAKKRGATAQEIAAIERNADAERLKALRDNVKQQEAITDRVRKDRKSNQEQIEQANEALLEANRKYNEELSNQQVAAAERDASLAEEKRKKQEESSNKAKQKSIQDAKEREQILAEANQVELEAYKSTLSEREREEYEAGIRLSENREKLQKAGITDFKSIEEQYQRELAQIREKYDAEDAQATMQRQMAFLELGKEQGLISEEQYQINLLEIRKKYAKSTEEVLNAELAYTQYINKKKEETAEQERSLKIDKAQAEIDELSRKNEQNEFDYEEDLKRFERQKELLNQQQETELSNVKLTEFERTQIKKKYSDQRTEIEIESAKTEKALAEAKKQAQFDMLSAVGGALGSLSGMFEKGTAAAKVSALSEIAVNTGLGFLQGLDIAQKGAKATGPAAPFAFPIFYATQIAAVLGAVSKAKAALSQVKGGGSTPNASAPSNTAPIKPPTPQAQVTQLNQESINALGNQAIKAYVIESDMTTNQQRIAAIRQRARFS